MDVLKRADVGLEAVSAFRFRGVAASAAPDREGDRVSVEGMDTTAYESNPVLMLSHEHKQVPVGKVTKLSKTKRQLIIEGEFPKAGISARADEARGLVEAGILRGLSVGLRVVDAEPNDLGGKDINESVLLEISVVPIPANAETLLSAEVVRKALASVDKAASASLDMLLRKVTPVLAELIGELPPEEQREAADDCMQLVADYVDRVRRNVTTFERDRADAFMSLRDAERARDVRLGAASALRNMGMLERRAIDEGRNLADVTKDYLAAFAG